MSKNFFWQVVAWLGALIMGISTPLAYSTGGYNVDMYDMGLFFSSLICAFAVLLLLLGGFFSKSRYIWIVAVALGIGYLVVLPRVWSPHETVARYVGWMDWRASAISAFPAVVSVIGGFWMRHRAQKAAGRLGQSP